MPPAWRPTRDAVVKMLSFAPRVTRQRRSASDRCDPDTLVYSRCSGRPVGLCTARDRRDAVAIDLAPRPPAPPTTTRTPPPPPPPRNALHVDHVDISWLESLTLEGRASYYDRAGAMKDMVQNHLMEAMALVLMDQPARIDADSFRGVRVEGLRAVATPAAETMRSQTVPPPHPQHLPRPSRRTRPRYPPPLPGTCSPCPRRRVLGSASRPLCAWPLRSGPARPGRAWARAPRGSRRCAPVLGAPRPVLFSAVTGRAWRSRPRDDEMDSREVPYRYSPAAHLGRRHPDLWRRARLARAADLLDIPDMCGARPVHRAFVPCRAPRLSVCAKPGSFRGHRGVIALTSLHPSG